MIGVLLLQLRGALSKRIGLAAIGYGFDSTVGIGETCPPRRALHSPQESGGSRAVLRQIENEPHLGPN